MQLLFLNRCELLVRGMLKKLCSSFMVQRLVLSGLTYVILLYLAQSMGAALYGPVAFFIFFLKNIPAMNCGVSYGFIFNTFMTDTDNIKDYIRSYLIISIIALSIGSILIDKQTFIYGILLLPIFILDPILKIKRIFICSLLPEFFLVIAFGISYTLLGQVGLPYIILATVILLILVLSFIGVYKNLFNDICFEKIWGERNWANTYAQLKKLITKGFTSYMYLLVFFLFLFTDRYFLQKYYPGPALGVCMLAFQLCQASLYVMSSWNFSSVVDIGELIKAKELNNNYILSRLSIMAGVGFLPLFLLYLGVGYVGEQYFKSYPDLLIVFSIISIGLYFSNLASSISPILFFAEKQTISVIGMLVCLVLVCISYPLGQINGWTYISVLKFNYSALAVYSVAIILYALYVLQGIIINKKTEVFL